MPIRKILRLTLICILGGLVVVPAARVMAQDAGEGLDTTTRGQLAAIPLTADALPDGYILEGESFLTVDQASASTDGGITVETLTDTGFVGMYASVYAHESGNGRITSYVSQWESAEAADAAIRLLEDEGLTDPDTEVTDDGLDIGDGPAEVTKSTSNDGGTSMETLDATFLVGPYVVGVTSEGTAEVVMDAEGVTALAEVLEERANTVSAGDAPEGVDYSLVSSTLDLSSIGAEVQAGFLSPGEAEELYGLSGSSLGNLQSSWVSLVATGEDGSAPYIVVGKSTFADAETAARVVEQAENLVPFTVTLEADDDFAVDGADTVKGFRYVSPTTQNTTDPNSFRAIAQVDNAVVIVDVQAAGSVDEARAATTDLLAAQIGCASDACEAPELSLGG